MGEPQTGRDPHGAGAHRQESGSDAGSDASSSAVAVLITDLDRQGRGIARHGAQVLFVEGGLPGDQAEVRLQPRRRGQLTAQLLRLLQPSPQRRRPPCILSDHCGGCSLQTLSPEGQQHWKQASLQQTLRRIGGLEAPLRPLLISSDELGYRNRTVIPLERLEDGRLRAGFYRRGSHRIVNMNHCPVLDPRLDVLIPPLKADLEARSWPVDRHGLEGGGLRHLALRIGQNSGEVLISLIASHGDLEGLAEQAEVWMARWPQLVGVTLNLQPLPTNQLFGAETRTLAGRDWLHERFAGLSLQIATDTFFQVNTRQAEHLVPLLEAAFSAPAGLLVDAYCGIGTFSLPLARLGWQVLGLEQHSGAVELAARNATLNGLAAHCRFQSADVVAALAAELPSCQALLLDPPRKGLDPRVIAAILECPPPRLAYLSCDPATLARDLRLLCASAYRLSSVQPIDLFPNTSHVETLAVLEHLG